MILDNANVLTMDAALPRSKVLAIAGGKVLGGVDSREDAIASHKHERIDVQGATVVPGFVDSHLHFGAWAASRHRIQLADAPSWEGLLDRVRMRASASEPGAWLHGGGWAEALAPTHADRLAELDAAADGRPVALVSRDGHALLVTHAALAAIGIDLDTAAVPGGLVDLDPAGGFTGVLREASAWRVRAQLPTDDVDMRVLAGAMRELARRGITSLHDMDGAAALQSWRTIEQERGLALRVWVHLLADDLPHAEALGFGAGFGSDRLAIGGVKVFADGTLGSGTALLHEPELAIEGSGARSGVAITAPDELRALARRAGLAGLPLLVHAIGDRAFTDAVDALEATQEFWSHLAMRPRIEHAQLGRVDDFARCARLGIALSVQPTMLVADRDVADARWGDRTDRAYAYRSMLDAGCGIMFGSDAPIENPRPLAAVQAALTRDGGGHGLAPARGAWHPEQAVDAEAALLASTAWPADATGTGDRLGRLTPGRAADLVVLSGDPLTDDIAGIDVVATMVGGRWTHGAANFGLR
ncbi:MAG: amidohydrolase [Thermoleophilia bacterium]|nr:amidohydrolase [Thermoleophilia bacterium]